VIPTMRCRHRVPFKSLFTTILPRLSLAAAEAADSYLGDDIAATARYKQLMQGIQRAYRRHLALSYSSEKRWVTAPFWRRRQFAIFESTVAEMH
jgi:hypothetical protein